MVFNTFRSLDQIYQDLMMLTPQQLADVSRRSHAGDPNAPPSFLIVAALDAQNKAQQRQMQPPTQTVAENVIAQAAQNQYQNQLAGSGVAGLPTARLMTYEGGGLVSFADGGSVPESVMQSRRKRYPYMPDDDLRNLPLTSEDLLPSGDTPSNNVNRVTVVPEPPNEPRNYNELPGLRIGDDLYQRLFDHISKSTPAASAGVSESDWKDLAEELAKIGSDSSSYRIKGPTNVVDQITADRKDMQAAGIDPEAELRRQIDLANKRRKEIEEYKEKGKIDILLQLGAAMMAGKSPHALVNIGEALQGTGNAIQEYRSAIDRRNELADEAEELAKQAAYKQKVGDWAGAKKDVENRNIANANINMRIAELNHKAILAAIAEKRADLRAEMAESGANTRNAQSVAMELTKLGIEAQHNLWKMEHELNLSALEILSDDNSLDPISDKDLLDIYKHAEQQDWVRDHMAEWKSNHIRATLDEINEEKYRFIRKRINDYMEMRTQTKQVQAEIQSWHRRSKLGENGGSGITSLVPRTEPH